ncbi:MAG: serine/threonine-protein kinase [Gemmatimonadales bacterium]|nr:serine/threonine-protein kinase [Gemmatimonadales bacterium]
MTETIERLRAALADRYHLERELGTGGMATVYLAEDRKHGRQVAVKVLRPELALALGADRFLREVAIAARLNHPNILALHDSGEADGFLYYVMPFLDGPTLRQRLSREGELPIPDAVRIVRAVADAMAYAHAHGVVHRDLKPENVMLSGEHAVVADFGVAKALVQAGPTGSLTATGMAVGTPTYMAPEQAAGDPQTDHRADIYAVGVLGYELLTGAPPFVGSSPQVLAMAHMVREPEPVDRIRPATPPRVAAALMRCLAKRPADRWQSAAELRQHLAADEFTSGETAGIGSPGTVPGSLVVTEEVCRRLDRAVFDPRMIGDRLHYLDNQVRSDVLVLLINDWGVEAVDPAVLLPGVPYRVIVPTLYGFEGGRKVRFPVGVADHLVLLDALLHDVTEKAGARTVVIAGFSAAGDLVLRLAADPTNTARIDGCLALGPNLGLETCFVTGILADLKDGSAKAFIPAVNAALSGAATAPADWLNLAEYFVKIVRTFQDDFRPIQAFARGIVDPWRAEGVDALIRWYRSATAAGRRVRCVFEDSDMYRTQIRALQLRNLDEGVLGDRYQPGSIVVEAEAGHFDLVEPGLLRRHLDGVVADVRSAPA